MHKIYYAKIKSEDEVHEVLKHIKLETLFYIFIVYHLFMLNHHLQ
jgi:hypothetical protein